MYPFSNSSAGIMLLFFWLYGAALVSYSYCLSTLFSSSRVAGTVVQLLYALSMLPGFVLPAVSTVPRSGPCGVGRVWKSGDWGNAVLRSHLRTRGPYVRSEEILMPVA